MKSALRTTAFFIVLALPLIPIGTAATTAGQRKDQRVPPNTTYLVVNKKGEKTREYNAGEAMPNTDCVQIKCPKVLVRAGQGKNVRCWRCGND